MNCAIQPSAMKFFYLISCLFYSVISRAQQTDSTTVNTLSTIEVKAYGQTRKLKDVPAAVGFLNRQTLERFSSASLVQAVNTLAGVRMEERSPGSYRINIRGSSLRSPFGVRNVKVYFNDIPFTDPGGHTYLNGLGYYNFSTMEVLKGPGSSLYGAGTGGVLLIESLQAGERENVFGEYATGSFGLRNAYVSATTGSAENKSKFGFQHQQSEGYRRHSALRRDVFSWTGNYRLAEKQLLKTSFLYSDLFYETPGALTKMEYETDPKAARPAGGGFPGAEQNRASIRQKTFLAGASLHQQFSAAFSNQSTGYAMYTELRNPTIRNYGKSSEPHVGGRTVFTLKKNIRDALMNVSTGGEIQQNFTTSTIYKNVGGAADSVRFDDEIFVRQASLFLQGNVTVKNWELTAGASVNRSHLRFRRLVPSPLPEQNRKLSDQVAPRLALARKFTNLTVYTSVSKGFSPPTSAELLPSGSNINLSLEAEQGTNFDVGVRGNISSNLTFDLNAFYFRLRNTIVQRRDAGGGDFFINAGKTAQKGVETSFNYTFLQNSPSVRQASFWLNHTYHYFRYKDFKQLTADFSGKALPGVAPHTIASGIDAIARNGLLANLTYFFSSKIPLNDANTDFAKAYHLLGAKIGLEKRWGQQRVKLVAGADNLLDQRFSFGNDINGFGGRFYNAAARRNYYASLILQVFTKKENPPLPEGL